MVGVPRSKGCHTCRRRKVACDQAKPHCQTCRKRGIECEGYAQYPVILQWTSTGLKKRERFEEVASPVSLKRSSSRDASASPPLIVPLNVDTTGFELRQMDGMCLEMCLPPRGPLAVDASRSWMWETINLNNRGRTLDAACSAHSLARLGLVYKDQSLIVRARRQYGIALTAVQSALYNPGLAFQDRTFAALRFLSIYELFVPTFGSIPTSRGHEEGLSQWCMAGGPQCINTDLSLMVFHDVRWFLMMRSLEHRRSSILGAEEWRTIPWTGFNKDALQNLIDIGFDIAAMLERFVNSEESESNRNAVLQDCANIRRSLDEWRLTNHGVGIDAMLIDHASLSRDEMSRLHFTSLWQANNVLHYWTFQLIINGVVVALWRRVQQSRWPALLCSVTGAIDGASSTEHEQQYSHTASSDHLSTLLEHLRNEGVDLSTKIVRAAPYFLQSEMGWVGPQKCWFPLRKAVEHLATIGSQVHGEARLLLEKLETRFRSR